MKESKAMEGMEPGMVEKSEQAKGPKYEGKESAKHIKAMALKAKGKCPKCGESKKNCKC